MTSYFESHVTVSSADQEETLLASAGANPRIARTLEIIGCDTPCVAHVIRKQDNAVYADIRIDLQAYDYILFWDGEIVILADTELSFKASVAGASAVLHYTEETA